MDNIELYKQMNIAGANYILAHINKPSQKKAFLDSLNSLNKIHFSELQDLKIHIEDLYFMAKQKPESFWDLYNTNYYRLLAYEFLLDTINSVIKRFETGGEGEVFLRFGGKL